MEDLNSLKPTLAKTAQRIIDWVKYYPFFGILAKTNTSKEIAQFHNRQPVSSHCPANKELQSKQPATAVQKSLSNINF